MSESFFKVALAILVASVGCMVVEDSVHDPSERASMQLWGYHHAPESLLDIQVFDVQGQEWIRLVSVRTSQFAQYDQRGNARYPWHAEVSLPDSLGLCPTNSSDGLFRAVARGESNSAPVITRVAPARMERVDSDAKKVSYTNLVDWPFRREYALANSMQGVTNDGRFWYFSTSKNGGRLAKVQRGADLTRQPVFVARPFPDYDHPGDMDYHDGWIYVALESYRSRASFHAIGLIPAHDFENRRSYRAFPVEGKMPWIARDPRTGLLYSSEFSQTDRLKRYRMHFQDRYPSGIEPCGEVKLSETIDRVQGGDFSPSGRLYLATDPQTQLAIDEGAIKVVDIQRSTLDASSIDCDDPPAITAEIVDSLYLVKQPGMKCWEPRAQEIEGITIWDLDDGTAHLGRRLGQIHTILIDLDCLDRNELYLKHTRVHSGF